MFYDAAVDDFVGLADLGASTRPHAKGRRPMKGPKHQHRGHAGLGSLGWSVQTPYGLLSPTKKVDLTNCQDLFARAQENFNLAAKHDNNKATYEKNMNLRYSQYQTCMTNKGQQPLALDTSADPTAVVGGVPGMVVAPPPSALQMTAAIAGGVLTPPGTVPTPSAIQAQQAAMSMTAPAEGGAGGGATDFLSGNTLITLGLGVAALAVLIVLMKKSYPQSSAGTGVPGVKV
jgi:hypothetical protein